MILLLIIVQQMIRVIIKIFIKIIVRVKECIILECSLKKILALRMQKFD
jgi:hypothetical protein